MNMILTFTIVFATLMLAVAVMNKFSNHRLLGELDDLKSRLGGDYAHHQERWCKRGNGAFHCRRDCTYGEQPSSHGGCTRSQAGDEST